MIKRLIVSLLFSLMPALTSAVHAAPDKAKLNAALSPAPLNPGDSTSDLPSPASEGLAGRHPDLTRETPRQAAANVSAFKAEVAAMEDAFCAMAREKGLAAAFAHYAAPDVAFIDTDPRQFRGPAAVRERMGEDQPGVTLTWSASFTDVSNDGTLGYNYGRYEYRGPGPGGKERVGGGWFLTIWKRQPDGSWKYVMDSGAPDRPAPKPAPAAPPAGN